MLWIFERVFDSQYPAPGVSQQHQLLLLQPAPHGFHFLAITFDRPQRRILGIVRKSASQLVVVPVAKTGLGQEILEALKVEVRQPRPPMQRQNLHARSASDMFGPNAVPLTYVDHQRATAANSRRVFGPIGCRWG